MNIPDLQPMVTWNESLVREVTGYDTERDQRLTRFDYLSPDGVESHSVSQPYLKVNKDSAIAMLKDHYKRTYGK